MTSSEEQHDPVSSEGCKKIDPTQQPVPEFDYDELSGGSGIVHIRFGESVYSLRRTRTGRLVLNK